MTNACTVWHANVSVCVGPRMCLSKNLARLEHFLILVTLLCHFQFVWHEDAGEPDVTPVYAITLTPKPYRIVVGLKQSAEEV